MAFSNLPFFPRHSVLIICSSGSCWIKTRFFCLLALGYVLLENFRRVRKIAKSDCWLRHGYQSTRLSERNNSAPTGRIFMRVDNRMFFFWKPVRKIQVSLKSGKNNMYFTWRPKHILIIFRSFLLRMKNVSDKCCREIRNIHIVFNNIFFENRTFMR